LGSRSDQSERPQAVAGQTFGAGSLHQVLIALRGVGVGRFRRVDEGEPDGGPGGGVWSPVVNRGGPDFDPEARERTFKVKNASAVQPVPPEAVAGAGAAGSTRESDRDAVDQG
jgi:hypothetical protein